MTKRRNGHLAASAIAAAMGLFLSAVPAAAQNPANANRVPDVQVIAYPGPTGEWAVSAVYAGKEPRAEAQARQTTLAKLTGWPIHELQFDDRSLDLHRNDNKPLRRDLPQDTDAPESRVLTSTTFMTPGNVVDLADGTVDVSPWVRAYRDKTRLNLTFVLPPGMKFPFRGLRHYSGAEADIDLAGVQTGAITYAVVVKNHQMEMLALPRYQQAVDTAQTRTEQNRLTSNLRQRSRALGTGLVVLFAIGAGALVYLWATRLSGGGGGTQNRA